MMQKNIYRAGGACSAVGCSMRCKTNLLSQVKVFHYPRDPVRRAEWAIATRRKNWVPTDRSVLCNLHFITGKPSSNPKHPDYIPSLFNYDEKYLEENQESLKKVNHRTKGIHAHKKQEKKVIPSTSKISVHKKEKHCAISSSLNVYCEDSEFIIIGTQEEDNEKLITDKDKEISDLKISNHHTNHNNKGPAAVSDSVVKDNSVEDKTEEKNVGKRRKLEITFPQSVPKVKDSSTPIDREDIFGQYVASEMKGLKENPLLYLQTKQTILEILTSANFELINPE